MGWKKIIFYGPKNYFNINQVKVQNRLAKNKNKLKPRHEQSKQMHVA
jgi:hypothetical protein